ncbi:ProQ/FINO family protein [Marinomonas transparens]|uniref:ProQ/FinO family protein n=1 Tax=Marinomonas transparens TaxID=2795388 RepID=A0A934JXC0_9GAMM|nr:ProQ/FinO family protein [Marinomonas transparens]MBJ7538939.1 ProQ/FinO family protein [Marinomonas transparens]
MEQLIAQLEAKVNQLTEQLKNAYEEIQQLKGNNHGAIEHSASMDLLQHMADRSTEDQVQLYIEDSLNLLETASAPKQAAKANPVETQLSFDLLYESAASSTTSTTTEQTDYMTIQETELNSLPEAQNDKLVDNISSTQETNDGPIDDIATLTPEQKKRQKNQKNNRRLIKMLEDRYPKAFDWNQPKPLKVGIDKDMVLDEDFNASKQKRALAAYTRSDRYKKCLLSGQPRVDLEGVAVNNEPALPAAMIPKKEKTTFNRPKTDKSARPKGKLQAKPKASRAQQTTPSRKKEDDVYSNLSTEERMKAKLEKLLNKS